MTRAVTILGFVLAGLASGCSNDTPTSATSTTPTTTITTPVTATFTGVVGPGGTLSRSFTAQLDGTARASLSAITPATALGFGMGVPRADGTGCLLTYSTTAANLASAEIGGAVASGVFCIQVYAPAVAAETVRFSVTLTHP